ncbi:MAG: TOMM precursor leader peptide-binding protein, partial [Actinomycetes bacterium]
PIVQGGHTVLRPRIKNVHSPFALPDNRIVIGLMQYGVASEIDDDADHTIEALLLLMDGNHNLEEICTDLATTHPDIDPDSVRKVIADLTAAGFVEEAEYALPSGLTEREAARYESPRHYYAWIDPTPRSSPYEIQGRLKQSSVAVVGLGGTGSAVASGLVASGVGAVHCVDFDKVEEPNLCRQLLYTEADIGEPKLDRALDRLRAMNSLVSVTGSEQRVSSADDMADLMSGSDALVLCADQPHLDIMRWTNEAALRTSTPWFVSLYTGPMAVVGAYHPGITGCWSCLRRQEDAREYFSNNRQLLPEGRHNAVVAASATVSGQLCALEVVYHLAGLPTQVSGRVLHWNFANWDHHYFINIPRYPDCPACGRNTS